jgi:streptomycin 6-kinase
MKPVDVPDLVRQRARSHGLVGRRWLEHLPHVVAELADIWSLQVGESFRGGTAALVTTAVDSSGRPCVLKVAMPAEIDGVGTFARAVRAHELARGRGCALLLEHDVARSAMLLERLGPNLQDLAMPLPRLLRTVATTLRSFWRPAPADCGLTTGGEKAVWLAGYITTTWQELGRPCPRAVIDRALAFCDERAASFDPSTAVLVHGDAHGWNTLRAGVDTYKLVDPEGLRSEPAHDLGIPMREYNEPLLAGATVRLVRERAEMLGAICDVDPESVWQWGFIERVSTGLANLREFEGDDGKKFLEVAARCV